MKVSDFAPGTKFLNVADPLSPEAFDALIDASFRTIAESAANEESFSLRTYCGRKKDV